jgi:hypothetical protein
MSTSIPDLWPEDLSVNILTPAAILKGQAAKLAEKTKGLLEAEVTTSEEPRAAAGPLDLTRTDAQSTGNTLIVHDFDLIAPALQNYRHRVMVAKHSAALCYPASVMSEALIHGPIVANSEQEFIQLVGTILQSVAVRAVIQSLIARSNEAQVTKRGEEK